MPEQRGDGLENESRDAPAGEQQRNSAPDVGFEPAIRGMAALGTVNRSSRSRRQGAA